MQIRRFMRADEFVSELKPLRAFGNAYVSTDLLDYLESAKLLRPRIRISFPDTIARRFWLETHEEIPCQMKLPVEPDGPRWEAAVDLSNALQRWNMSNAYRLDPHPLDDPDPQFVEFIKRPMDFVFKRQRDRCVDVSSDAYEELFDDCNFEDYYSSWQALLAVEVADAGIHIGVNLADRDLARIVEDLRQGRIPADASYSFNIRSIHAARDFEKHERALDAIVWFTEERQRILSILAMEHGGKRFRLTQSQREQYDQSRQDLAKASINRFRIDGAALTELIRFLSEYWSHWDREGRPYIAAAYKEYLGCAVSLKLIVENITFAELRDRIGRVGGWFKPILDVVWPNWSEEEKERARLTLKGATGLDKPGALVVSDADIEAFVNFLAKEGLEAFFWRLNSFENHALRGNEFAPAGMKADVQGMAIVVEHVAAALGGTDTQLYAKFKQIWRDPNVLRIFKKRDTLIRQSRPAEDWPAVKEDVNALRSEPGGQAAADLVLAYRVRGGVHSAFPEDDHLELEALFIGLMRAALRTFIEVRCNN